MIEKLNANLNPDDEDDVDDKKSLILRVIKKSDSVINHRSAALKANVLATNSAANNLLEQKLVHLDDAHQEYITTRGHERVISQKICLPYGKHHILKLNRPTLIDLIPNQEQYGEIDLKARGDDDLH